MIAAAAVDLMVAAAGWVVAAADWVVAVAAKVDPKGVQVPRDGFGC